MVTILVIDDIAPNVALLVAYLQSRDIMTLSADTGKSGFDVACSAQPDLILLDLRMPERTWDGYMTMQHLQGDPRTAAIPVIALSADIDLRRCRDYGFAAVLERPFPLERLDGCLSHYLGSTP